jgi:hypothetical protein
MQNVDFVECSFISLTAVIVWYSSTAVVCQATAVFTSRVIKGSCV